VKYVITLKMKILAFTISPSFSGSTGFDCPLTQAQIEVSIISDNLLITLLIVMPIAFPGIADWWRIMRIDISFYVFSVDICNGPFFPFLWIVFVSQ